MRAALFVLAALLAVALANRPRGVAPADKALYLGPKFKCKDGLLTLAISQVNDDYCDCHDGSDEPGTSACPNGAFWCKNKGFRSSSIPSWKVNDHICDCCDGGDEYDGHVKCPNTCAEMDRESKKSVFEELERLKSGLEKKKSYIATAEEALRKAAASISDLKLEVQYKREEVKLKEDQKRQAEDVERDAREARKLKEDEEKAAHAVAHPPPLEPSPSAEGSAQVVDAELRTEGHAEGEYDIVHDEAKGDIPEDMDSQPPSPSAPEMPPFEPSAELKDLEVEEKKYEEGALPPPHIRDELQRGYLAARKAKQSLWQKWKSAIADALNQLLSMLGFSDDLFSSDDDDSVPDSDAKRARDVYNEASNKLQELEERLSNVEKLLQADLGPQKEFYPLFGQTYSAQIEQYRYEVKPFHEVNQGHTNMGKWGVWSVPYSKMSYTGGQSCWQGPARSCEVTLLCGDKEEILEVKEPNKCEYAMKFTTPAACNEADVERLQRQLQTVESDEE